MTAHLRTLTPQPLTPAKLARQRVEKGRIAVLDLVKIVTGLPSVQAQTQCLAECRRVYPEIDEYIVDHEFRSQDNAVQAIDTLGGCLLLRALHLYNKTHLKESCMTLVGQLQFCDDDEAEDESGVPGQQPKEPRDPQNAELRAATLKLLCEEAKAAATLVRFKPWTAELVENAVARLAAHIERQA
jgi:hypothetical protein